MLTPQDLKERLEPLLARCGCEQSQLVVAVSGGGDFMALALLAHEAYAGRVHAVTIDHGLRAASAGEAMQVGAWLTARGIPHRTRAWRGQKPPSGIQAAARGARYALLSNAAIEIGGRDQPAPILTAHTLDDQEETIVMRAAHGSGPEGLTGMRAVSEIAGAPPIPLVRPLLNCRRDDLRAALRERSQAWLNDPSNEDERFERVRVRRALQSQDNQTRAGTPADKRESADEAMFDLYAEGFAGLDRAEFERTSDKGAALALSKLLRAIGGSPYPPHRASVAALAERMRGPEFRGATLAGCRVMVSRGQFQIVRELRHPAAPVLVKAEDLLWDRRFFVRARAADDGLEIRAVGTAAPSLRSSCREGVPLAAIAALPALWAGQNLVTPLRLEAAGATRALFVGLARVENRLTEAWRDWRAH